MDVLNNGKYVLYIGAGLLALILLPSIFCVLVSIFHHILIITLGTLLAYLIGIEVINRAVKLHLEQNDTINGNVHHVEDETVIKEMTWFKRIVARVTKIYHRILHTVADRLRFYYKNESDISFARRGQEEIKDLQDQLFLLGQTPDAKLQCGTYVCVSQNVDMLMNRIFEYTFRDYVETWYATVSNDRGVLHKLVKSDFWETYDVFTKRLAKVDIINLVMNRYTKTLTQYFSELDATDPVKKKFAPFHLHPCLRDGNCEKEFLRRISEYIIRLCFPYQISSNSSSRVILREILAGLVFLPLIETVCDPDYINLSILSYVNQREAVEEEKSRTYTYAATYEDFIKIISSADNLAELRQIHRHIMTELMHATAINSLKRDDKKVGKAKSMAKGQLLLSRDLKKYINQCQVARQLCAKRLAEMGGNENQHGFHGDSVDAAIASSVRLLTYDEVMTSHMARSYFLKYLKSIGKGPLLKYWCEIDIGLLKETAPAGKEMAKVISHLYQTYIVSGSPDELDIEIDKATLRGMQHCVLGNKDPDDFLFLQKRISTVLEKEHYPSFVVSDFYIRQLMPQLSDTGDELSAMFQDLEDPDRERHAAFGRLKSTPDQALTKLREIEDKLEYKAQALESLRPAARQDHKLTKVLEAEIAELQEQKLEQQLLIERTDIWWARMGSWTASIQSASVPSGDDTQSKYPVYSIVVLNSDETLREATDDVSGWVVERNLEEFQQLHQELKRLQPNLKKQRMPTLPVISFGSLSEKFLATSKNSLNDYLSVVLKDQILSRSEFVYAFLNPSTGDRKDDAKRKRPTRKTGLSRAFAGQSHFNDGYKNSLWQFGSLLLTLPKDILDAIIHQEEESSDSDEEEESLKDVDPDSIAAPLYELINEVFEIHGLFRALRKTLIVFVRLAFGGSINKQIRETVQWLVSEPMLTYYLQVFIDSMWPDGKLKPKLQERTEEERLHTALEAQVKFLENVPEALQNLIGHENARRGFSKVFRGLQDKRLNKHLFYRLLEQTVEEVFPEILKTD